MKNKCNTLFFKIIIVVLGAILCLAGALSVLNIKTSQDVFVENFVESQQKIFRQIDENIYELFQNVTAATSVICGSSSVREYLGREVGGGRGIPEYSGCEKNSSAAASCEIQRYESDFSWKQWKNI